MFSTIPISELTICFTIWGFINVPPLATALTAATIWRGVTVIDCPNDDVAKSTSVILSFVNPRPVASPGISIPVFLKNPNASTPVKNFSFPVFWPICIKAGLHEFCTAWVKFCNPWPLVLAHFIALSATTNEPPQVNESFSVHEPVSKAIEATTDLKVEPGS